MPDAHSVPNPPPQAERAALIGRKQLVSLLASYEQLAKRIVELPLPAGTSAGSSQDRLQRAMGSRAQNFLAEKLALLKGLGFEELDQRPAARKPKPKTETKRRLSLEERASKLAVLLEQEQLVKSCVAIEGWTELIRRSYLDSARAARQLDDAAALKQSLDELRSEIQLAREG